MRAQTRRFAAGMIALAASIALIAMSASAQPNSAADKDKEAALQRVMRLRAEVGQIDQDIQKLSGRLPALKKELEELTAKVVDLQPPPKELPKEKVEEKKEEPKQVEFRPPLFQKSTKKTSLAIVCQDQRVYMIDLSAFLETYRGFIADVQGGKLPTEGQVYKVAAGDYDVQITDVQVLGNSVRFRPKQVLKSGHTGEPSEKALTPESEYRTRLGKLDPANDRLQFVVFPDSYESFRSLRKIAWDRKFDMIWIPFQVGQSIIFTPGAGGVL